MVIAKYDPGLLVMNRSVFEPNEVPIAPFYCKVNAEMYSVGGSKAHSFGVILEGTLICIGGGCCGCYVYSSCC